MHAAWIACPICFIERHNAAGAAGRQLRLKDHGEGGMVCAAGSNMHVVLRSVAVIPKEAMRRWRPGWDQFDGLKA